MTVDQNARLFILGGISGIVGTFCYVIAITTSFDPILTYAVAMVWPVLSIVFVFSLNRFIRLENNGASNQLAFIFACLAFTIVACMISIQTGVGIGMNEYAASVPEGQHQILELTRRYLRLIDLSLDVAWDIFIGIALLFLSLALQRHKHFGLWWSISAAVLGPALIVLNLITFPWPPNSRHLFDIGPVIGLFILALATRLLFLGNQMRKLPTLSNTRSSETQAR